MSNKALLAAFKKYIPKTLTPPNPHQQIANFISKSLKSSKTFDHMKFAPTWLNPHIINLVLSNTQFSPQSCFSFFNSLEPDKLNLIEPYIALSYRLFKSKEFALAKDILNRLAVNDNIEQPNQKITSFVKENCSIGFSKVVVGKLFDTLFRVYADNRRFEKSSEVFEYMKSNGFSKIDDRSCMVFLLAAKRCEKYELLSEFFRKMVDWGVMITVYSMTMVVSAMCKLSESCKARELMNEMITQCVRPNAHTYNALIDAHLKNSVFSEVKVILDSMKRERVCYTVATYTLLIEFYSRLGKIKETQKVFDEMREKGIVPDVHLYTSIISCYYKLGNMKRAFELFDEMTERGLVANIHTYEFLINGVCKVGEMKAAEVLLLDMQSKQIDINDVIINTLMDCYCKKVYVDDVIKLQTLVEKKAFELPTISLPPVYVKQTDTKRQRHYSQWQIKGSLQTR